MSSIFVLRSKKLYMSIAFFLALFAAGNIQAQPNPKLLPTLKEYKSFDLKKNTVNKVTYRVYSPNATDPTKIGETADFVPSIEFDAKGMRVKETVFHIDTLNQQESLTSWDYNTVAGTVTQIRLDKKNEQKWKRQITGDIKKGTGTIKTYEPWFDEAKSELVPEKLVFEDEWRTLPKTKSIQNETTTYSLDRDIISKRSTRDYQANKVQNLNYYILMTTASDDFTWLPSFEEDNSKANTGSLRKEKLFDGTSIIYKAKKKLIVSKTKLAKDGKTVEATTTYAYEFDKSGNWVKVTQSENGKPRFIVLREIEYRPKK